MTVITDKNVAYFIIRNIIITHIIITLLLLS